MRTTAGLVAASSEARVAGGVCNEPSQVDQGTAGLRVARLGAPAAGRNGRVARRGGGRRRRPRGLRASAISMSLRASRSACAASASTAATTGTGATLTSRPSRASSIRASSRGRERGRRHAPTDAPLRRGLHGESVRPPENLEHLPTPLVRHLGRARLPGGARPADALPRPLRQPGLQGAPALHFAAHPLRPPRVSRAAGG